MSFALPQDLANKQAALAAAKRAFAVESDSSSSWDSDGGGPPPEKIRDQIAQQRAERQLVHPNRLHVPVLATRDVGAAASTRWTACTQHG